RRFKASRTAIATYPRMNGRQSAAPEPASTGDHGPRDPPSVSRGLLLSGAGRLRGMATTDRSIPGEATTLDPEQLVGLADMDPETFRAAAHRVVDLMADYIEDIERHPVLPSIAPGTVSGQLPTTPPNDPETLDAILGDFLRLIEPNATAWQHPGFFAYFASTASGPGILGEMLTAGLGQNPMLWRTSPSGTELEQVVVDWLRRALGLPDMFDGLLTDTASTSSLIALAAARQTVGLDVAVEGLAGR